MVERTRVDDAARQPLPNEIAHWLIDKIQAGKLGAGDRVPTERELCERFSVSRTVVREALSSLKSEGLVKSRRGSGVFVNGHEQRKSFRMHGVSLKEKKALAHIIELLVAVEVVATRLAALRRTPDELKRIRRSLLGMEYAIAQGQLGDEEDFAFHQSIVDATHNPHFRALSDYLAHSVRRLIRQARSNTASRHRNLVQAVQQEHQAIYQAIEARDAAAAASAAETHLRYAAKRLGTYLTDEAHVSLRSPLSGSVRNRRDAVRKDLT